MPVIADIIDSLKKIVKKKTLSDFLNLPDPVPGQALSEMEDPLENPTRHLMVHEVAKIGRGKVARPRD